MFHFIEPNRSRIFDIYHPLMLYYISSNSIILHVDHSSRIAKITAGIGDLQFDADDFDPDKMNFDNLDDDANDDDLDKLLNGTGDGNDDDLLGMFVLLFIKFDLIS